MFKFVLCALFAVAAAKPDLLLTPSLTPLTPLTTYVSPATTTITKSASGFISSGPYVYSSPLFAHYIKKRSAPLTYIAPTTYFTKPLLTTYSSPLIQTAPYLPAASLPFAATHYIKKRSAPFATSLATSYIAPATYSAPLLTSTLTTSPLVSTPLIAPTPLVSQSIYATHYIKKRSAPLIASYPTLPSAYNYYRGAPFVGAYRYPYVAAPAITAYRHVL